jgi:ATP-dependent protease ClpP protease subunit
MSNKKARNQYLSAVEEVHLYDISTDSREIYLHGETGPDNEDNSIDYRVSNKFLKNLRLLEQSSNEPIIIHLNSIGGGISDGLAIYDSILHSSNYIILIMHGSVYSMATIVAQASDIRVVMPNCLFLVHSGSTEIVGTHKQSQSQAQMEKELEEITLNIYTQSMINGEFFRQSSSDKKKVRRFLNTKLSKLEDWWLWSDDVIRFGLADGIFGQEGYESIEMIKKSIKNE